MGKMVGKNWGARRDCIDGVARFACVGGFSGHSCYLGGTGVELSWSCSKGAAKTRAKGRGGAGAPGL